ncbi:YncE family protein [Amycolatopsis sp. GM8]|uniref:YncE family protein n=1 Tax=Amycolatopsis sp. GM8 TaxID=2896530 RepID=UPI001F299E94|nr:YncE family protein [Amycolatopsis sp. GM8]
MIAGLGAVAVTPAEAAPRVRTIPVGPDPALVAVNSGSGAVYVGNGDNSVSIVDGVTVEIGGTPTDLSIDEASGQVYAASEHAGTVTVFDPAGRIRGLIAAGPGASVIDLDADDNRLYAAGGTAGSVAVIDTVAGVITGLLHGPGHGFGGIRVDSGRRVAYLSNVDAGTVEVLDLGSRRFTTTIPVGQAPTSLALHDASNTLYVANSGIHHLSVVDGASHTERARILLRSEASSVAVHQSSHTVYANGGPDGIVRIDGAAGKITGELSLGINPGGIAVDQRSGAVHVTDPLHDQLYVIDGF